MPVRRHYRKGSVLFVFCWELLKDSLRGSRIRLRPRIPRFLVVISPALTIMLCLAIFLYFKEFRKNVKLNAQLLALSQAPQPVAHSMRDNTVSVAFLSANVLREPSALPEFTTPPTASFLELQIELTRTTREEDTWDAEVLRGEEVVWKSSRIPMHRIGQTEFLALFIDTGDIRPGVYVVQYAPTSNPGATQHRSFRVIEPR